jgi:hypothetical protein
MIWKIQRAPKTLPFSCPFRATKVRNRAHTHAKPVTRNPLKTQAELGFYGRSANRRKTRQNACPLVRDQEAGGRIHSPRPFCFQQLTH